MDYECFAVKSAGYSHVQNKVPCQDSVQYLKMLNRITVAVADGHGSKSFFRSDRGSNFAVEIACKKMNEFLEKSNYIYADRLIQNDLLNQLKHSIVTEWKMYVREDILKSRFTVDELENVQEKNMNDYLIFSENKKEEKSDFELKELLQSKITSVYKPYGTTLISVGITDDFAVAIHIGDGKCVAIYEDGSIDEPVPWDENCHLNICTSICDSNAIEEFRTFIWRDNLPVSVFIATDGIDDTFADNLHSFYSNIALDFAQKDFRSCVRSLDERLPDISKNGSQDDVSIAGLIDEKRLIRTSDIIKKTIDEEKNRIVIQKYTQIIAELNFKLERTKRMISSFSPNDLEKINLYEVKANKLKIDIESYEKKISDIERDTNNCKGE